VPSKKPRAGVSAHTSPHDGRRRRQRRTHAPPQHPPSSRRSPPRSDDGRALLGQLELRPPAPWNEPKTEDCEQEEGCPAERHQRRARPHKYPRAPRLPPPPKPKPEPKPTHAPPQHPVTPPPQDPMRTGDPPPALQLGPVLGTLPADLLQQEVLRRLGPRDLASLAGAGRGCAAAVAATVLMQWAKRWRMTAPFRLERLCVRRACPYAARCGNRKVLEWLHNTGCPWDTTTACMAARFGHFSVLQWAREHHCPWDWATPANAACGGHLAVLQWAQEQDCPWDSTTCIYATTTGQLEVLQWVRENDAAGAVWSERRVRQFAGGPRKQEVLSWLDELSAR